MIRPTILMLLAAQCLLPGVAADETVPADIEPVCVYVSSYHQGFEWSDRLEDGLREILSTHCRIVRFDMDTKRHKQPAEIAEKARQAMKLIDQENPSVVITSDDNAARYLIVPYLKDTTTPVVFSGINWTIEEYGFPTKNITGIVEVGPITPLLDAAKSTIRNAKRVSYLSADTLSEKKNFQRWLKAAADAELQADHLYASTMKEWIAAFNKAQTYDLAIIGGVAGIKNWIHDSVISHVEDNTAVMTITTHDWLMPFATLGYTLVPEELGRWAGSAAVAILDGAIAGTIPVVTNRQWDKWVNQALLKASGTELSESIRRIAKQVN